MYERSDSHIPRAQFTQLQHRRGQYAKEGATYTIATARVSTDALGSGKTKWPSSHVLEDVQVPMKWPRRQCRPIKNAAYSTLRPGPEERGKG